MNQLRTNYSQPKEYYTNQKPTGFNYNAERRIADTNKLRAENLSNFKKASKSPESLKTYVDQQEGRSTAPSGQSSLANSFNRMGLGNIGGLGGRMGDLEKASMRLGQAASQRRMGEAEQESNLRGGMLEKEYGFRKDLAQSESDIQSMRSAQSAGYSSPFEMQEDIRKKRIEQEQKQKEQENFAKLQQRLAGIGRRV
jgi:hypothetical protein